MWKEDWLVKHRNFLKSRARDRKEVMKEEFKQGKMLL
jgi:hypothetical protein